MGVGGKNDAVDDESTVKKVWPVIELLIFTPVLVLFSVRTPHLNSVHDRFILRFYLGASSPMHRLS